MKKLFTLFLIIVCLLTCHACQQDDEERWPPDDKRTLEVFVYYRQGNEMRVDYGAKIYLYYDCEELYNLTDFDEYQGNGLLVKDGEPITPFCGAVLVTDAFRTLVDKDRTVSILVESAVQDRVTWTAFPSMGIDTPIKLTWILNEGM